MKPQLFDDKRLLHLRQFLSLYKLYSEKQPQIGGVQTLVDGQSQQIRELPLLICAKLPSPAVSISMTSIDDLPIEIFAKILQLLAPSALCRVGRVQRKWYQAASSEAVWEPILEKESHRWAQVYSHRFPEFCKNACVGMTSKHIYLACHPNSEMSQHCPTLPSSQSWSSNMLTSHLSRLSMPRMKPARIIMFGPGLEGQPSRIVRNLLNDSHFNEAQRFRVSGMTAGLASGLGSGLSLCLNNKSFDLITLYSNARVVREQLTAQTRLENNRLFERDGTNRFQIRAEILTLCQKCDGFVFVVDATKPIDEISQAQDELSALLSAVAPQRSVLVVNCTSEGVTGVVSPMDVAKTLHLGRLNRKWMVQSVTIDTLTGLREGMGWLLEKC